jgi:hypothetical protein
VPALYPVTIQRLQIQRLWTLGASVTPESYLSLGADSYVGGIAIDEKDTIEFDLGWYSYDLTEYQELHMMALLYQFPG